jgi:hypothetical protein
VIDDAGAAVMKVSEKAKSSTRLVEQIAKIDNCSGRQLSGISHCPSLRNIMGENDAERTYSALRVTIRLFYAESTH